LDFDLSLSRVGANHLRSGETEARPFGILGQEDMTSG